MSVLIWEGDKAQALVDAVKSTKNVVNTNEKFRTALLSIVRNVSFNVENGDEYIRALEEAFNELTPGGDGVKYIYASQYGVAGDGDVAGVTFRKSNDRTMIGEISDKPFFDFKPNQDNTGYVGKFPMSPIHIPLGAITGDIYIEGADNGTDRYLTAQLCRYSEKSGNYPTIAGTNMSTKNMDVSSYNDGSYYLHIWSGRSTEYGHNVIVNFTF